MMTKKKHDADINNEGCKWKDAEGRDLCTRITLLSSSIGRLALDSGSPLVPELYSQDYNMLVSDLPNSLPYVASGNSIL